MLRSHDDRKCPRSPARPSRRLEATKEGGEAPDASRQATTVGRNCQLSLKRERPCTISSAAAGGSQLYWETAITQNLFRVASAGRLGRRVAIRSLNCMKPDIYEDRLTALDGSLRGRERAPHHDGPAGWPISTAWHKPRSFQTLWKAGQAADGACHVSKKFSHTRMRSFMRLSTETYPARIPQQRNAGARERKGP